MKKSHNRTLRASARAALLVAVVGSIGLSGLAAHADVSPPPAVHVVDGGDAVVNQSESPALELNGTYDTDPLYGVTEIVADVATDDPNTPGCDGLAAVPAQQFPVTGGTWTATFDVGSLGDGAVLCGRARTFNGTYSDLGFSDNSPAIDLTGPAAGTVDMIDANGDGYLNADELDDVFPATWSATDATATASDVWFEDEDGAIAAGCGPWTTGSSGAGNLNQACATSLPEGKTFTFRGRWTDAQGNLSDVASSAALLKDATAPAAPAFTAPTAGAGYAPGSTVTVAGTAEAGSVVTVKDGASTIGSPTADAEGAWSATVTPTLEGLHSLTASATDAAGNAGSASGTSYVIDGNIPVIVSPAEGGTTAGVTTVSGTGKPSSKIELYEVQGAKKTLIGSGPADSLGNWAISTGFSTGAHTIQARGISGAATSALSAARTFGADAGRPTVAIDNADLSAATEGLSGTAADNAGVVRIELTYFNAITGATVRTATATCATCGASGSSVTWTDAAAGLTPGLYRVEAKAVDAVGNRSNVATTRILLPPSAS